jgi:serine/threonine-protein kinase PRP4
VLEEETDPEKVLEERRRKREEIMAKFKANGGKAVVASSMPGPLESATLGSGADSVHSGGLKTGERTGMTTGVTTGEFSDWLDGV